MENMQFDNGEELKSLELNQKYNYLGFAKSLTTNKTAKSALKNKYFKQLKMILKSKLWILRARFIHQKGLEIIDRETQKMLQQYQAIDSQCNWLDCISREKMVVESLSTSPTTTRMQ